MSDCGCNKSSITKQCGCGNVTPNPVSPSGDYLLVKAAPNHISECASDQIDPNADRNCCAKFDITLADTSIPLAGLTSELSVTNGLDYAVGQWVYFPQTDTRLKITLIDGNKLSLRNGCDDGTDGLGNPPAGTGISRGSTFYVIDEPKCQTTGDQQDFLDSLTEGAEDVLLPNLLESDGSETVQIVGVVMEDDDDPSFRKALKRSMGITMKGGRLFLSLQIPSVAENALGNYHPLVMNKDAPFEIKKRKTFAEQGIVSNKVLTRRLVNGVERYDDMRGMYFLTTPILLYKSAYATNGVWTDNISGTAIDTADVILSSSEITALDIFQTEYIAHVRGTFNIKSADGVYCELLLNGVVVSRMTAPDISGGTHDGSNISAFVKVLKSDNKIKWEVKGYSGSGNYLLDINVDCIFH